MPSKHVVKQGECLSSIARHYGFAEWRPIYNHPDNAEFRKLRPNPDTIHPGDEIVIPDRKPKSAPVVAGKSHRFEFASPSTILRLAVLEDDEAPLAGADYRFHVGDDTLEGKTDDGGLVEQPIPANAESARVVFADRALELMIHFGHLDPIEEPSGVQARLNNLGFWCGEVDGAIGPKTRGAIASFQAARELEATGELTDETRERLRADHDGR